MPKKPTQVKSVRKGIRIVEKLEELHSAGVTELSEQLELPKSSVHNYLQTFENEGYIISENKKYRLSLQFLNLGAMTRKHELVYEAGRDEVDTLAEETDELVNLMVEEQGKGVYIYRSSGNREIPVDTRIGKYVYLTTTALGKAILAHYPEEEVKKVIDQHGIPKQTENTITNKQKLLDELNKVAERGIAFDNEERLDGIKCVATSIHGTDRQPLGSLSISAPAHRMKGDRYNNELPDKLLETSNLIELQMKYDN